MMNRIFLAAAALLMLSACGFGDVQFAEIQELGYVVADTVDVIPAEGGSQKFLIYSNGKVSIKPKDVLPQWARLDVTEVEGDDTVTVTMDANGGFERMIELVAVLEDGIKEITIPVRQYGSAYIFCANPYKQVKGSVPTEVLFEVDTNIPEAELVTGVTYLSGSEGWVRVEEIKDKTVKAFVSASVDAAPRKAQLMVNLKDAADSCGFSLFITQASSTDQMGQEKTFAEVRSMATAEGVAVEPYTLLKGVIVSDYRSSNMEHNPVLPLEKAGDMANTNVPASLRSEIKQVVDTTASLRTAYMQSPDGTRGFKLVFSDPSDNVLTFGSYVTLDLGGAVVTREDEPERYTISGLTGMNLIESVPGSVPERLKKIGDLTDEDMYTFVHIQNVEFPVKEGSYTDVRSNAALYGEANAQNLSVANPPTKYFCFDGYATTLVDADGKVICCPINMLCNWRRPAEGIPQGSGNAKGVITYSDITRYGDAGRYQLRVLDQTGFEDLKNGASNWTVLAQWDKAEKEDYFMASCGSDRAKLACEKTGRSIGQEHSYKSISAVTEKTCGISDEYHSIRVSSGIKGWYEWEEDKIIGYKGMLLTLSTKDISGSSMLLSFRFYAGKFNELSWLHAFPSHWCVEYLDGQEWKLAANGVRSGKDYVHLKGLVTSSLTLNGFTYLPSVQHALGATGHSFALPAEVFGKEELKIRIRPFDNVMSSLYPVTFTDDLEYAQVRASTDVTDYVSFQDIILSYR